MEEMVRFAHISKRFGGVHALKDVSLTINKGEVHALLGENGAGKSTLMNILSGVLTPDEGEIYFNGEAVRIPSPYAARALGIATVYQELRNCDNLTVAENIFLGREERKGISPNWKSMEKKAAAILNDYGIDINPRTLLGSLTVAQKQMIEIAKAINMNADVLILDEPTSALTVNETSHLFENLRILRDRGVSIIYISHRLGEIFEIADTISMLRNGSFLGTFPAAELTGDRIISMIAGKDLSRTYEAAEKGEDRYLETDVILKVRDLESGTQVKGVSFDLHEGEILGFYGLQGSGRTETMEAVFGIRKKQKGTITLFGKEMDTPNVKESIANSIGMITEERKLDGVFFNMDVCDNIAIIHTKGIKKHGLLSRRKMRAMADRFIGELSIKCQSSTQAVGSLSGGNQQKVVLSRCLSTDPALLILDEPTRGVDVGAKVEIYNILRELRDKKNKSMIIISSELPEIIMLCDRVVVMHGGVVTGVVTGKEINEETILQYAFNERKNSQQIS